MITLLIIWLIGYIILFGVFIIMLVKKGDFDFGDLVRAALFSIFSWAILIIALIEYINSIITYKKKK